jgi:Rha family phage regulatory protein
MDTSGKIVKLHVIDGIICASSRDVYRDYRKRHADVIRAVDDLISNMKALPPTDANLRSLSWFGNDYYYDAKQEKRPCRLMTEEGFSLLVGGFTGQEALEWNIAYHIEFQNMKAKLGPAGARNAYKIFERPPNPQTELFAENETHGKHKPENVVVPFKHQHIQEPEAIAVANFYCNYPLTVFIRETDVWIEPSPEMPAEIAARLEYASEVMNRILKDKSAPPIEDLCARLKKSSPHPLVDLELWSMHHLHQRFTRPQ